MNVRIQPVEAVRAPRGRPRDPELDDEILAAAGAIVAESGTEALTMEAVARRAGVAKATVYRRFPHKVDLLVATCNAAEPPPLDAPDTGSVRGDLVELLTEVVGSFQHSDSGRLMPSMLAAGVTNPEVREAMHRVSAGRRSRSAKVLRRAVRRGEITEGSDLELISDQLVGAVMYRFLITGRPLSRSVVERLVDQVLAGVAKG